MNLFLSLEVIHKLKQQGVVEYCLCPGGRNAPLVKALQMYPDIQIYTFFDERAAAFFALGLSKKNNRPSAVVTTSGSAVANLLPAAVEAFYSQSPIVLLTGDRPKEYRQSGAPQSIEQIGIFSKYVSESYDFDLQDRVEFLIQDLPVHVNLCFDEPLLGGLEKSEQYLSDLLNDKNLDPAPDINKRNNYPGLINDFLRSTKSPLVIIGPGQGLGRYIDKLLELSLPIYAEASSGLRESKELSSLMLQGGAQFIMRPEFLKNFDSVIRLGQVPTIKLWRELENKYKDWPVLSFTQQNHSGLARDKKSFVSINEFLEFPQTKRERSEKTKMWVDDSMDFQNDILNRLVDKPCKEEFMLKKISEFLPENSKVFLGNSKVIREWDQVATHENKGFILGCNRGVNGIDGLISTALGWADKNRKNFCIVGDLSAMYDMNALHILKQLKCEFHLIVINNGGGKIFKPMFNDSLFENPHNYSFKPIADMFGLKYYKVDGDLNHIDQEQNSLIEVIIEGDCE